jgi:fermentation-respiration switch protein FrsA (DUF1100 family)
VLVVYAEDDCTVPPEEQIGCYEALGAPKKLVKLPNAHHYESYYFCNPEMHMINYAVPLADLDTEVDRIVGKSLEKPAHALAWTKRSVNGYIAAQHNQTLDAAADYEMVNFLQWERAGFKQEMDFE